MLTFIFFLHPLSVIYVGVKKPIVWACSVMFLLLGAVIVGCKYIAFNNCRHLVGLLTHWNPMHDVVQWLAPFWYPVNL